MPKFDALGIRMKGYEYASRICLPKRLPVIIRLDGKAFHTYTRTLQRPFDERLSGVMSLVAIKLCEEIQGAQFAYVQSDEISILVHNYKRLETSAWFDNNVQKIVSVSAGIASAWFTYYSPIIWGNNRYCPAIFDSRVSIYPEAEVCNYFIWRQKDAIRNSIQAVGQAHFSPTQLHKKSCNVIQEMLFQEKGINWNNTPTQFKRGFCIVKQIDLETNRSFWRADNEIPEFTQDRHYVEKYLEVEK